MRLTLITFMLAACSSEPVELPPRPEPPFRECKAPPAPLPPIATIEQVRARHDVLSVLYLDCAERARRNAAAVKE